MKKMTILLAVFLLATFNAQELQYGVTGMFHKSSIVGVHDVSKGKFGGSLGFFVDVPLVQSDIADASWLLLTPQIEYNMGGENAEAELSKFGIQKFHHDYVAAQVLLKWFVQKQNGNTFLFIGPRIEFMVREDRKVDPAYDLVYYQYNLDNTINKVGIGATIGAGYKLSPKVEAFLRYDRGFSKVYPDNPNSTYNHMLGLGVNYYLSSGTY